MFLIKMKKKNAEINEDIILKFWYRKDWEKEIYYYLKDLISNLKEKNLMKKNSEFFKILKEYGIKSIENAILIYYSEKYNEIIFIDDDKKVYIFDMKNFNEKDIFLEFVFKVNDLRKKIKVKSKFIYNYTKCERKFREKLKNHISSIYFRI
ncbi:MAG: hypothetical protein ABIL45_03830 [candidate division WOR-3 bacterium]